MKRNLSSVIVRIALLVASCAVAIGCSDAAGKFCDDGDEEVPVGGTRCRGWTIEECQEDAEGEPVWVERETCVFDENEICFEGACIEPCGDGCAPGRTDCPGGLLHECEQDAETGCTHWVNWDIGCED